MGDVPREAFFGLSDFLKDLVWMVEDKGLLLAKARESAEEILDLLPFRLLFGWQLGRVGLVRLPELLVLVDHGDIFVFLFLLSLLFLLLVSA